MSSSFAGTQFVEGLGWVETPQAGVGALHGEADVMMISGLGNGAHEGAVSARMDTEQIIGTSGSFSLSAALTQRIKILGIELPAYVWALIALGVLGAGWVFLKKKKIL